MNRRRYLQVATFAYLIFLLIQHLCAQTPVVIRVDAGQSLGPLNPVWNYFGYDEPNYTYAQHGRELIGSYYRVQSRISSRFDPRDHYSMIE